jgi:hypothetical protein
MAAALATGCSAVEASLLVVVPVSSMKMSFSGSRSSCPSNQAGRATFTSLRCCSAACAVFFLSVIRRLEEAPKRADPSAHPALLQLRPQIGKGHIRRLGHEAEDDLTISLDPTGAAIPALPARRNRATRLEPLMPSHRARRAHPKPGSGLSA